MKWSKLKKSVESGFAESLGGRVAINSTRYGNCTCGRAWLTVDGVEIANFCTRAKGNLGHFNSSPSTESEKKFAKMPVAYGELSRQDAYRACWAVVHDLSIEEALTDSDPLVQTLAVLDSRVGRKKLASLASHDLHALARKLLEVRWEAEGITTQEAQDVDPHASDSAHAEPDR